MLAFRDSVVKLCPGAATCPPPAAKIVAHANIAIGHSLGPHPLSLPPHIVNRARRDAKWIWTLSRVSVDRRQCIRFLKAFVSALHEQDSKQHDDSTVQGPCTAITSTTYHSCTKSRLRITPAMQSTVSASYRLLDCGNALGLTRCRYKHNKRVASLTYMMLSRRTRCRPHHVSVSRKHEACQTEQ